MLVILTDQADHRRLHDRMPQYRCAWPEHEIKSECDIFKQSVPDGPAGGAGAAHRREAHGPHGGGPLRCGGPLTAVAAAAHGAYGRAGVAGGASFDADPSSRFCRRRRTMPCNLRRRAARGRGGIKFSRRPVTESFPSLGHRGMANTLWQWQCRLAMTGLRLP